MSSGFESLAQQIESEKERVEREKAEARARACAAANAAAEVAKKQAVEEALRNRKGKGGKSSAAHRDSAPRTRRPKRASNLQLAAFPDRVREAAHRGAEGERQEGFRGSGRRLSR